MSQSVAYYRAPSAMTDPGRHACALATLSSDLPDRVAAVQGWVLHEHHAEARGVPLTAARRTQLHLRSALAMLDALGPDGAPLDPTCRDPAARLIGVCRHYVVLLTAMLRAAGTPARARVGFATYLRPGRFEAHWLCEYWDADRGQWRLADPQLDPGVRDRLDFDPLDVPAHRFVDASRAWQFCRGGDLSADAFGLHDQRGRVFVAASLVRDIAALNKQELLPWDAWGGMVRPDEPLPARTVALLDLAATLATRPDDHLDRLQQLYASSATFRVPDVVFNTRREQAEAIG